MGLPPGGPRGSESAGKLLWVCPRAALGGLRAPENCYGSAPGRPSGVRERRKTVMGLPPGGPRGPEKRRKTVMGLPLGGLRGIQERRETVMGLPGRPSGAPRGAPADVHCARLAVLAASLAQWKSAGARPGQTHTVSGRPKCAPSAHLGRPETVWVCPQGPLGRPKEGGGSREPATDFPTCQTVWV